MKFTFLPSFQEPCQRLCVKLSFRDPCMGFVGFLKTRQFAALFTDHWETQRGRKVATSTLYGKVERYLAWNVGPKRFRENYRTRQTLWTHGYHEHRHTQLQGIQFGDRCDGD